MFNDDQSTDFVAETCLVETKNLRPMCFCPNFFQARTFSAELLFRPSTWQVLVDELGRGTSNRDGGSLAHAVAEALLQHPKTFTLFATHYLQLAGAEMSPTYRQLAADLPPTCRRRPSSVVPERASAHAGRGALRLAPALPLPRAGPPEHARCIL